MDHKLYMLPLPEGGKATPADARDFFEHDLNGWRNLILAGLTEATGERDDVTTAFARLFMDVCNLAQAFAEALATGAPVPVEGEYEPGDPDYREGALYVAHVFAALDLTGELVNGESSLLAGLGRELRERLEKLAPRPARSGPARGFGEALGDA